MLSHPWGSFGASICTVTYIQVSRAPSELLAVCPHRQESGQGHAAGSFGALACTGLLAPLFKQGGGKMTWLSSIRIAHLQMFFIDFVHWVVEKSGGSNQIWSSNQLSHLIQNSEHGQGMPGGDGSIC
jgi:hypothetical protein